MDLLAELLALLAIDTANMTDEELGAHRQAIVDASAALAAEEASDEALEALDNAATAVEDIDATLAARAEEAEQRAQRAQAALERMGAAGGEGEGDGEGTDGDAEGEGEGEGDGAEGTTTEGAEGEGEGAETPEAIAAAAAAAATLGRRPRAARVTRVAARRPAAIGRTSGQAAAAAGVLPDDIADWGLVASANVPGQDSGQPIRTREQLAAAFIDTYKATLGYQGGRVKMPIARVQADLRAVYGEERTLDMNVALNVRKINAVTAPNAIVAAGGICVPIQPSYDLPIVGDDERPMRDDFMTRFGADRGGVRTIPPPTIDDLDGAIDFWTNANDISPGSDGPATKPCLTISCPDEDETLVEAVTKCLETGNFRARYFPEQVEAWMRLAAVAHARAAEQRLIATVADVSNDNTLSQVLGTTRDLLTGLIRAAAVERSVHRISRRMRLVWAAPFWALDNMRVDIARQLPVGTLDETLAVADAQIEGWFRTAGIEPVWLMDGESGQQLPAYADGQVPGWPSTIVSYLSTPGAWLFLDGGSLDLGLVRDSTLNSTNDLQMFSETFEGAHFHGTFTRRIVHDVCPDGSVSAAVDINPCTLGS